MDDRVQYAREVVGKDPMAVFLGIKVDEVRRAYARLSLCIGPQHSNATHRAHGIAICSIIDQAVAVASNSIQHRALVVELKINFLGAVSQGDTIVAEASVIDLRRKLSLWQVEVKDSRNNLVAVAQALAYHRSDKDD